MKLVWSDEALVRLTEIEAYIARDNPLAARRWIERLIERAEVLVDFPRTGRIVPEYERADVRELVEKNYRIFYRVRDEAVEIVTVFEGHRLPPPPPRR